jgi:hypothetical protein
VPKGVVATNLFLTVHHVLRWRIIVVNKFCTKINEYSTSVSRHLFESKKVYGYSSNGQRLSVPRSLSIIDVDLYSSFDGAAAHKNACREIKSKMHSGVSMHRKF